VPSPHDPDRLDPTALVEILAAERRQVLAQLADLTSELDAIVEVAAMAPPDDEHDPEGATVGFERARVIALSDRARAHLADLDRAGERMRDGTFGVCQTCGRPIPVERLRAKPTAASCVVCAGAAPSPLRRA
jgi:RNA polymerase-binding transcription factor DksA